MKCAVLNLNCFTAKKFLKSLKRFSTCIQSLQLRTTNCLSTHYWYLWWSFFQNINGFQPIIIFTKSSILDVWQVNETVLKHWFHRPVAKQTVFSGLQALAHIFLKLLRRCSIYNQKIVLNMSNFLQKIHKFQSTMRSNLESKIFCWSFCKRAKKAFQFPPFLYQDANLQWSCSI